MTNVQLREELFREINPLLDNEDALKRVLVFLRSFSTVGMVNNMPDEAETRIKLKDLKIPAKLRNKRGCIKLTEEDMKDEHIQYILNR
jgi:hypothetical protein